LVTWLRLSLATRDVLARPATEERQQTPQNLCRRPDQPVRDVDEPVSRGGDHRLAVTDAVPTRLPCGLVRAVSWCSQPARVAASSAPHIHARLTSG
jgi:hypothetical protein